MRRGEGWRKREGEREKGKRGSVERGKEGNNGKQGQRRERKRVVKGGIRK